MSRVIVLCALLISVGMGSAPAALAPGAQEKNPPDPRSGASAADVAQALTPLAIAGFRAGEKLDPRDAWMPMAVEETLTWRLRRVRALIVVPTIRTHQARRELAEDVDDPPAEWSWVVRLLGAKLWLKGTCSGTPDACLLNLELISVDEPTAKPAQTRLGPGRLFAVIDEATRWALGRLGISRLDQATEGLIFAAPSASPSALEYFVKALFAARSENFRDGAYYAEQAVVSDPVFRPALLLLAKMELRAPSATRARAAVHLRQFRQLAAAAGDAVAEAEFELAWGLLEFMTRSSDSAEQRLEFALASAFARDDRYGQLAALNSLCDLWLSRRPPTRGRLSADVWRRFQQQNLRRAAEWQVLVLDMLQRLGDVIAEVPAANKLALIHERLGEAKPALEMHKRTIAAARQTGSRRSEATGWMFLGQWYRRQERWQEALEATSRCLALVADEAKPTVRIALADIYRGMSLPREALGHYESAWAALAAGDDLINQFRCLRAIAELRMERGEREPAIEKLTAALDIAQVLQLAEQEAIREQLERWKNENP